MRLAGGLPAFKKDCISRYANRAVADFNMGTVSNFAFLKNEKIIFLTGTFFE